MRPLSRLPLDEDGSSSHATSRRDGLQRKFCGREKHQFSTATFPFTSLSQIYRIIKYKMMKYWCSQSAMVGNGSMSKTLQAFGLANQTFLGSFLPARTGIVVGGIPQSLRSPETNGFNHRFFLLQVSTHSLLYMDTFSLKICNRRRSEEWSHLEHFIWTKPDAHEHNSQIERNSKNLKKQQKLIEMIFARISSLSIV